MSSSPALPESHPFVNPSYPKRTHFDEQKALLELLGLWNQKLEGAARKLQFVGTSKDRGKLERLYHQAMGARDQIAESARRLPREAGDLYDEDCERCAWPRPLWNGWPSNGKRRDSERLQSFFETSVLVFCPGAIASRDIDSNLGDTSWQTTCIQSRKCQLRLKLSRGGRS